MPEYLSSSYTSMETIRHMDVYSGCDYLVCVLLDYILPSLHHPLISLSCILTMWLNIICTTHDETVISYIRAKTLGIYIQKGSVSHITVILALISTMTDNLKDFTWKWVLGVNYVHAPAFFTPIHVFGLFPAQYQEVLREITESKQQASWLITAS